MAHFIATGTMATDLVRRETRKGVLTTFRLAAGQPGRGQVWIDVETWGHLAGTVYHHGTRDQHVIVAGRLTQKSWQDRATGQARRRLVVTAHDVDLLHNVDWTPPIANAVIVGGVVDTVPTTQPAGNGTVTEFIIRSGRAGAKTGRLWLPAEHWSAETPPTLASRDVITVQGRLAYRTPSGENTKSNPYYIAASKLEAVAEARSAVAAASAE